MSIGVYQHPCLKCTLLYMGYTDGGGIHTGVGLQALLVLGRKGMREPPVAGRAEGNDSCAFFRVWTNGNIHQYKLLQLMSNFETDEDRYGYIPEDYEDEGNTDFEDYGPDDYPEPEEDYEAELRDAFEDNPEAMWGILD